MVKWVINLSEFYDFKIPGKYKVEISRRMIKFNKGESVLLPPEAIKIGSDRTNKVSATKRETYVIPLREAIRIEIE